MAWIKKTKFAKLYEMTSGISTKPEQAGHGEAFLSFSTVFNNHFIPDVLEDKMKTNVREQETYSIRSGDVFLTRTSETLDELGMSCVAIKDYPKATYSGFLKRLRPLQTGKTYAKFMGFYLRSKLFRKTMNNNAIMTLRASLNEQIFSYLDLLLPEYNEQKKIGDLLYLFNTKIELNNQINAELELLAKLIYDYWFVQFDFPMSKKQAEALGKPELEGKPYKSSGGKMVYNEELKREVPEGWEVKSLWDVADFTNGIACQRYPSSKGDDYLRVIKIREMGSGFSDDSERVNLGVPDKVKIEDGDVLFSWSATLDVQMWTGGPGALNQHIFKVTSEKYPKSYYYFKLRQYLQHFKMIAEKRKTTMGHITQAHLKQSKLSAPHPNSGILNQIEETLAPILDQIVLRSQQNRELSSLRDWLIPMLLNGQVRVRADVEKNSLRMVAETEVANVTKKSVITHDLTPEEKHFLKRKVLATYIINQSLDDKHFGRTKFEKLLHLVDHHAIKRNFGQQYIQKVAGPYDNKFTVPFFQQVTKSKWFTKQKLGKLERIIAGPKHDASLKTYDFFSEAELTRVNALVDLFKEWNYEMPEIISTLYAVWNNRLIKGETISDDHIKRDFLAWDPNKIKYEERLDRALQWMREHSIVPDGWGKSIDKPIRKKKT